MKRKSLVIRVRKVAPKRFIVEQRRRFLFWHFYQKGCYCLHGLAKFYSSKLTAKTAIQTKAKNKNVHTVIIFA